MLLAGARTPKTWFLFAMSMSHSPLIAFAILLYASWNAAELFLGWGQPHVEQYSWIVFLVWAIPLPLYWLNPNIKTTAGKPFHALSLWAALAATFVGVMGSVNTFTYLGFAIAISAFLPFHWTLIPWLFSALSWLPAFGWVGIHYFPTYLLGARFLLAALGTASWVFMVCDFRKERAK